MSILGYREKDPQNPSKSGFWRSKKDPKKRLKNTFSRLMPLPHFRGFWRLSKEPPGGRKEGPEGPNGALGGPDGLGREAQWMGMGGSGRRVLEIRWKTGF